MRLTLVYIACLVIVLGAIPVKPTVTIIPASTTPDFSNAQFIQLIAQPSTVFYTRAIANTAEVRTWAGGSQATATYFIDPDVVSIRALLSQTPTEYLAIHIDGSWVVRTIASTAAMDESAAPGNVLSTLFSGAFGGFVATGDPVYSLQDRTWLTPTAPNHGWVATRFGIARVSLKASVADIGQAVRFVGVASAGNNCVATSPFVHKTLVIGKDQCTKNMVAAAFLQQTPTGDGLIFFIAGQHVHVLDTGIAVTQPNMEPNLFVTTAETAFFAMVGSSDTHIFAGGAVVTTTVAGEYLYVFSGRTSVDSAHHRGLLVYNHMTNLMSFWQPFAAALKEVGSVQYVRAIDGQSTEDVLLITSATGQIETYSVSVAELISRFSTDPPTTTSTTTVATTVSTTTATTAGTTAATVAATTAAPIPTDVTRVEFFHDEIHVSQFVATDRAILRNSGNPQLVYAYDALLALPVQVLTTEATPYALYSDGGTNLVATAAPDSTTLHDHTGAAVSGPTAHNAVSMGTVPDATWFNALEDSTFTGALPSTVVVATTAAIVLVDRVTGALMAILVGGPALCTPMAHQPGTTATGQGMCARNIVSPALLQTATSRVVYFQLTGSAYIFELNVLAAPGATSVTVHFNFMSAFPPAPPGTVAPFASDAHDCVSGVAVHGSRAGEVFFIRPAAAFALPTEESHDVLVWNSLDNHSRWVDNMNIRGPVLTPFQPASIHGVRLVSGAHLFLFGGTGTTTAFSAVSVATAMGYILPLLNECIAGIAVCSGTQTCRDTLASWDCPCPAGFHTNGFQCDDDDECADEGTGNTCDANAACGNTNGGYTCACNTGFIGTGQVCVDVNECMREGRCPHFADCTNSIGGSSCACAAGFTGNPEYACYPVTHDETFADGVPFGNPTVIAGGTAVYSLSIDRTSSATVSASIVVTVTNALDMLVLDFLSVPLLAGGSLAILLDITGPVDTVLVRNLIIDGTTDFAILGGGGQRIVLVDSLVSAPAGTCFFNTLESLVVDSSLLECGVFLQAPPP